MSVIKVLSATNFSGNICHRQALNWSDDNKISLTTEKAIHILVPQFRTNDFSGCMTYQRQLILAPDEVKQFDVDINREIFHEKIERETLYELMVDRTLSPMVASQQSYKGYRLAQWSPKIISLRRRCVLATLTMDHRLEIYKPTSDSFKRLFELSDLLARYVKSRLYEDCCAPPIPEDINATETKYYHMKQRVYTLAAVTMVWTQLFTRKPNDLSLQRPLEISSQSCSGYVLLLVAMKSGHIVVWKLLCSQSSDIAVEVLCLFHTEFSLIETISWLQIDHETGLLAVGSHMGQIRVFYIKVTFEDSVRISLNHSSSCLLWEDEDRLAVTQIRIMQKTENCFYLLAGKGSYFVGFELVMQDAKIKVKRRAERVGHHIGYLTGIIERHESFIVSSADGCLQKVVMEILPSGLNISTQKLALESNNSNRSFMGLTKSPSGVFLCSTGRLITYFDHIAIKEPINLLVFSLDNMSQALSQLLQHSVSLSEVWDVLLYIHMLVGRGEKFPEELQQLMTLPLESLKSQSSYTLQVIWWLLRANFASLGPSASTVKTEEKIQFLEKVLLKRRLSKNINLLGKNPSVDLSEDAKSILHFMGEVLQSLFELDNKAQKSIHEVTSSSAFSTENTVKEKCPICDETIPLEHVKTAKCPNMHIFGRCCLTAQATTSASYLKCSNCDAVAQNLDWLQGENCAFCDGELR